MTAPVSAVARTRWPSGSRSSPTSCSTRSPSPRATRASSSTTAAGADDAVRQFAERVSQNVEVAVLLMQRLRDSVGDPDG
jgi:hypothetical protein